MQKFLISLSRHRSVMVPVVTLLAISIGISGYYIQNRQIVAREEERKQQEQADATAKTPGADTSELSPKETVDETTKITEDGQAAEVVDIRFEVENDPENSEVILRATIDSDKGGGCVFYLKQNNYGPEETVKVSSSSCEARLQNPGIGEWEAKVLYTSEDGQTRGDALQTINL